MMPNIKKMIFKESQKISKKTELDIMPEELANLALYKILNLPYFENVHDFIKMHYNVFDEITLGLPALNNVKGFPNDNMESFVIQMDKNDQQPDSIDYKNQILNNKEYEIFKSFMNDINTSKNLDEIIKKVETRELDDPFYLNKIMTITGTQSYNGNKLIRAIEKYAQYNHEESVEEFKFEQSSKTKYYRRSRMSGGISDFAYNHYNFKGYSTKTFEEIMAVVNQRDIDAMTGLNNFMKEDLENFHNTHPNEYEKSVFKIFKEIPDAQLRNKAAFDLNHFKNEVKILNDSYKKLLKNETCEQLLLKYDEHINNITKVISKQYPQILEDFKNVGYEINRFVHMKISEKLSFIKQESPLEIFHSDYKAIDYRVVRGLRFFKNEYHVDEGFYISANNGLEDIASAEGYIMNDISFNGHRDDMKNIRLSRITEVGREVDIKLKQDLIEDAVKLAQESKCPFVYDIIERDHKAQEKFNKQMMECIKNLKEKYPNVIFFNDCVMLDKKDYLESTMKAQLLVRLHREKIPYEKIIWADNELEKHFKTDAFIASSKLDYSHRMYSTDNAAKLEEIVSKVTKNKTKTKLSI